MSVRPLLAALIAATWLLPGALAGGAAVHLAFEHGHDSAHRGADDGLPESALAALVEHGHGHSGAVDPHEHLAVPVGVHVARAAVAAASADAGATWIRDLPSAATGVLATGAPPAPPPRVAGPPLLARLATLRI